MPKLYKSKVKKTSKSFKLGSKPKFRNIILFAIAFAAVASILLFATHAAAPTVSIEPETSSSIASPASKIIGDSSASGSSYVKFSTSSSTGLPNPLCAWTGIANQKFPCAADTGVPAGTTLHALGTSGCPSSGTLTADNATYTACNFTGGVTVNASNVHIVNSQFGGNSVNNSTGLVISYSTFTSSGCNGTETIGYQNYELDHVKVVNYSDGPRVGGSNIFIHDSYIATCFNSGDHADGIQSNAGGGSNVLIQHNTIENVTDCLNANAAVFVADHSKSQTYDNNYLACGQYVFQLLPQDSGNGVVLTGTNNVIRNGSWQFGACKGGTGTSSDAHVVWSNNRIDSTGALAPSPCN